MKCTVFLLPSTQRDLNRLEKATYQRCYEAILTRGDEPRSRGAQKLVGEDGYRVGTGDWRILYRIDDREKKVFMYRVKHRREVYK